MALTGAQNSVTFSGNQPFIDTRNARREGVTLDATTVDSTNTPTTQLRKGLVVGLDSSEGNYVDAGDSLVDAHSSASVDSSEAPDGDWDGQTLTVSVEGLGSITHTLGANTTITNLATAITDINASGVGAFVTAANDGSGNLRLTANQPGARLEVSSDLDSAYGAGVTASADADLNTFGILETEIPSTLGINDTAVDRKATIIIGNARVRESDLLELNQAARQYFARNNIILE